MILSGPMLIVPVFRLLRLRIRGARIILQEKIREDRTANLYCELGWVSLSEPWNFHKCLTVFNCLNEIYRLICEGFFPIILMSTITLLETGQIYARSK